MGDIAATPAPPYYAVVFTARRADDLRGYAETAREMRALAAAQDGFLGMESAAEDGVGITASYWRDLDSIKKWKANLRHLRAQKCGREQWYADYRVRVARVEREYGRADSGFADFAKTDSAPR